MDSPPHTPPRRHLSTREVWGFALLLSTVTFLVYQFTRDPAAYNRGDNYWYVPTAQSLLADGDVDLRGQYDEVIRDTASWNWMSIDTPNGRVNYFGFGTSLLILPVVAAGNALYAALPPADRDDAIAALAARVLAALSVGLMVAAAATLGASAAQAVFLAALFAVATPHVSIHAGGLWSHNAVLLCHLVAIIILAGPVDRRWWSIVPLAVAFYCRPSAALPLALTGVWLLQQRAWTAAIRFAVAGVLLLVVMLVHWKASTGWWLPPYYAGSNYTAAATAHPLTHPTVAFLGHLFSPNRGLLVFLPATALALAGIVQTWRHEVRQHTLFRLLSLWLAAHLLLISSYPHWWLGHSFGPRAWAEMLGVIVLLLLPFIQRPLAPGRTALLRSGLLALAMVGGIAANARGAFCVGAIYWNVAPVDVDSHPERVWQWSDLQMRRGYCGR